MTAPAMGHRLFGCSSDVLRLVARFEDGTLPTAEWTHEAHLAVALWYASRLPYQDALAVMRQGIQRLNRAHRVRTTPAGGYHETITMSAEARSGWIEPDLRSIGSARRQPESSRRRSLVMRRRTEPS
jgi:hypothetical protein